MGRGGKKQRFGQFTEALFNRKNRIRKAKSEDGINMEGAEIAACCGGAVHEKTSLPLEVDIERVEKGTTSALLL